MQKNKPSEKKIYPHKPNLFGFVLLLAFLFSFLFLVKNEPNVIKNGFIHSETFKNRKRK